MHFCDHIKSFISDTVLTQFLSKNMNLKNKTHFIFTETEFPKSNTFQLKAETCSAHLTLKN